MSDRPVFFFSLKTRASLRAEVVVATDASFGIFPLQLPDEGEYGSPLGFRPCVSRLSKQVESALVADADGVLIVARAVGSDHGVGTSSLNGAITTDDVVVAYHSPPLGTVPRIYLACTRCLCGLDCRAVDDEISYLSHKGLMFLAV